MRRNIAFLLLFLFVISNVVAQEQYAFRVFFKNKIGAPEISNASTFLSSKALQRRTIWSIPISENDRPLNQAYIDTVLNLTKSKFQLKSKWLNYCVVLLSDSSKIHLLDNKSFVSFTQYISNYGNELHQINNKFKSENEFPSVYKSTSDSSFYGASWQQNNLLNGICLHAQGYKGKGKLIAVLDDGFNYVPTAPGFDSLFKQGRIIDKKNFVTNDTFVYGFGSHGTQILSTISGNIPNNFVGAAPDAEVALYITEDITSERPIELDNFLAATERADSIGADIISSSLGYNYFDAPSPSLTYANLDGKTTIAAQAVNIATQKGIVCVISAGNEGGNSWNYILTPGDADSALTIGSVDINKNPAGNSGYGPNSAGIQKPDVCALGNPGAVLSSGPNPIYINGTSIATPQIAGFTACLMQANPSKNPYQIKNAIKKSSHLFTSPNYHIGYGVPDFCKAAQMLEIKNLDSAFSNIKIFPNPTENSFWITFIASKPNKTQVLIYNNQGQIILSKEVSIERGGNKKQIELPTNLSSGLYFGTLRNQDETIHFKISKQ